MTRWGTVDRPVFESTNAWGIPDLLPGLIAASENLPRRTAMRVDESGEGSLVIDRTLRPRPLSVIGFWLHDYRIEPLWSWPGRSRRRLTLAMPAALIEPDFSQYEDLPRTMTLWNLYRSRWTARYWQANGLRVIPSLSWQRDTIEQMHLGIPRGSIVACECRPRFKDPEVLQSGLQLAIERIDPAAVLLYGAEESLPERLPDGPRYVRLPAWSPKGRLRQSSAS